MIIDGRMLSELSADEIELRMAMQERSICQALSRYHPASAILAWLDTLRAIEECINLVAADWSGIDEHFFEELLASPMMRFVAEPRYLIAVRNRMTKKFSANFSARFGNLMIQGVAISHAFALQSKMELFGTFNVRITSRLWIASILTPSCSPTTTKV